MTALDPNILETWRRAVGAEHVDTGAAALDLASTATFATAPRVPAIVRPGNRAEVQACVRIAVRHGTPIYPISRGRNWGYGSRVPPRDGSVVLDLGRMDLAHPVRAGSRRRRRRRARPRRSGGARAGALCAASGAPAPGS